MSGYYEIGGGYSWAPLHVGLVVRNPEGSEIYCQPGDDADAMRANIAAIVEAFCDPINAKHRDNIADMALGDYFA